MDRRRRRENQQRGNGRVRVEGFDYFLIECKWEKEPIEAAVVRELYEKFSNRAKVRGVVASMSGFTDGAVKQFQDFASDKPIIAFGRQDFESMLYSDASFEDTLKGKHQKLATKREVTFQ